MPLVGRMGSSTIETKLIDFLNSKNRQDETKIVKNEVKPPRKLTYEEKMEQFDSKEVEVNGMRKVGKNGKLGFVNNQGDLVIPLIYDGDHNTFRHGDNFDSDIVGVQKNGLAGVIDKKGKTVVPFGKFDSAKSFMNHIFVTKDSKEGCLNSLGEVVIPIIYDDVGYGGTGTTLNLWLELNGTTTIVSIDENGKCKKNCHLVE